MELNRRSSRGRTKLVAARQGYRVLEPLCLPSWLVSRTQWVQQYARLLCLAICAVEKYGTEEAGKIIEGGAVHEDVAWYV